MNKLPILKIVLAGFAFAVTHWKKLIEITIVPLIIALPFLLILPEIISEILRIFELVSSGVITFEQISTGDSKTDVQIPENFFYYFILFAFAYASISIHIIRVVVLGEESVKSFMPTFDIANIGRYLLLLVFISLTPILSVLITGIPILQMIVSFLIIPITLSFVRISLDLPIKYKWSLNFPSQINLFFIQIILPQIIGFIFIFLAGLTNFGELLYVAIMIILFYWSQITLGFCYKIITQND